MIFYTLAAFHGGALADLGVDYVIGTLDVWVVEDPLPRQLRYRLLLYPINGDRIHPEPIEPSHIADVVLIDRNPLCIRDDRGMPSFP